ncbi:TetR/AcrR family transcriptional regulator [Methylocella tundrae]|uniref:TetR family transcriptional regulator n=1 Tax=Methylocella tundrae TaxID=227605 RepID=A0A4V6IMB0_METTU|nr:TetR/AcrR family transcriptional regulator [Methylocella tundrae]WPP05313.1 TetR/AcrR family transcriptional regulator [Methylocella tundrae]VFU07671.1 TetR family transcriptional regulator [Methylocella tundrae]
MKNSFDLREHDTYLNIVDVAERLFAGVGFQKTTVADIAHELHMSPANVYRFFSSKAEINEAVGRRLLSEIETTVGDIVSQSESARQRLREIVIAIREAFAQRLRSNRKLFELVETAFNENWPIVHEHVEKLDKSLGEVIAQGAREGEFHVSDPELAAMLVRSACLQFCHPRLMLEREQEPEPTVDQMIDFCLAALG